MFVATSRAIPQDFKCFWATVFFRDELANVSIWRVFILYLSSVLRPLVLDYDLLEHLDDLSSKSFGFRISTSTRYEPKELKMNFVKIKDVRKLIQDLSVLRLGTVEHSRCSTRFLTPDNSKVPNWQELMT